MQRSAGEARSERYICVPDLLSNAPVNVLIDVGDEGFPLREVGLDEEGAVVHRYPDKRFPDGRYGLFDAYPFAPAEGSPSPGRSSRRHGVGLTPNRGKLAASRAASHS